MIVVTGATGNVTAPFGDVALPTIDPADIAAVAAALGVPIRFAEQSVDDARAEMSRFMPPLLVTGTLGFLGAPTPAEQQVSPHVEQVTGRAPGTFAAWARRHAAAFRSA